MFPGVSRPVLLLPIVSYTGRAARAAGCAGREEPYSHFVKMGEGKP